MTTPRDKDIGPGMQTDRLIELLARDAVAPARFGSIVVGAAAASVVLAAVVYSAMLHPRPDFLAVWQTARVLFKFAVTVPLAVFAIGLVDRLGRPAAPVGPWPWLLAVMGAVLGTGIAWELWAVPSSQWGARLIGQNARYCLLFIPLIAAGPLACFIVALRQGIATRPGLSGATAGLAASGIAAAVYATHCPDDSPLFVGTWYVLATGLVIAGGFWAGRRFLT